MNYCAVLNVKKCIVRIFDFYNVTRHIRYHMASTALHVNLCNLASGWMRKLPVNPGKQTESSERRSL